MPGMSQKKSARMYLQASDPFPVGSNVVVYPGGRRLVLAEQL